MDTVSTEKPAKNFFNVKELLAGVIILVVFGLLYYFTLNNYLKEGQDAYTPYEIGDTQEQNNIQADVKVLSLDPVKGEVALRVNLTPQGSLTEDGGYSATKNLSVIVNSATGQMERTFDKGKVVSPFDIVVNLDGMVNEYPFDKYDSSLFLYVTAKDDKDSPEEEVPVLMDLTAYVPGFDIQAVEDQESSSTAPIINLAIKRSSTVINVAVAGMVIMWSIGVAVVFLTLSFLFRNRKAEAFAFYSGLLFGLFGLRNSLPGTPPIGTTSDYLAFIWVEAIVAVMMVVTIAASLMRPQK